MDADGVCAPTFLFRGMSSQLAECIIGVSYAGWVVTVLDCKVASAEELEALLCLRPVAVAECANCSESPRPSTPPAVLHTVQSGLPCDEHTSGAETLLRLHEGSG